MFTTMRDKDRKWSRGVDRAFSKEDLDKFLSIVDNPKHRLCFMLQAYAGLRIGEACAVNLRDVQLDCPEPHLVVRNIKTGVVDRIPLIPKLQNELRGYIEIHKPQIVYHEGYLVYSKNLAKTTHVISVAMRNTFRRYLKKANLDEPYWIIQSTGGQCKGHNVKRKLYRLSTHSLRHFYGTSIWKETKDLAKLQRLMRHKNLKSTQVYINITNVELADTLNHVFEEDGRTEQKMVSIRAVDPQLVQAITDEVVKKLLLKSA